MWAQIRKNQDKEHKDLAPLTGEEWLDELPYAKQFKEMNQRMLKFLEGFGFVYGGEFIAALEEAEKINARLVYGDRDVRETMAKMNDAWGKIWNDMTSSISTNWKAAWNDSWSQIKELKEELKEVDKNTKKSTPDAWYKRSDDGKTQSFGTRHKDDVGGNSGSNSWESWFFGDQSKIGDQGGTGSGKYAKYENMTLWEAAQKGWEESKKQREETRRQREKVYEKYRNKSRNKKRPQTNWKEVIGLFTNPEETVEAMKDRKLIREKFKQMEDFAPDLVEGLVNERDKIMADNLKQCDGKVIVAVVGIGHMDGMEEYFKNV